MRITGIDVGTTKCKCACIDEAGKPVIIANGRGEFITPSALHRDASGRILIGRDAIEQAAVEPEGFVSNFKLKLGSTETLLSHGAPFTPTDAAAALMRSLIESAEKSTGEKVESAVLTCPANFRDDSKQALLEACQRVGVECLLLLPEPSAAGLAYAHKTGAQRETVAVYDLGGGTFDASILEVDGETTTVLATAGRPQLGGNDFSAILRSIVLDAVEGKIRTRPDPQKDLLFFLDLDARIETAKASLGTRAQVPIVASFKGQQVVVPVEQSAFRAASLPLLVQSHEALDEALNGANRSYRDIDRLIMVGGPSRDPFIQERLAEHTGLVPRTDIDPERAVAYGAALTALCELARRGQPVRIGGRTIPAPNMLLRNVTAHAVGCAVLDHSASNKRLINAVVVPRNTPVPCHRIEHFYLEDAAQDRAQIEVLQGEPDANRDECLLIGELLLDQLPPESVRSQRIAVEYAFDRNGMVTVTATDKVSGRQRTVSVDYRQGIKASAKPASV